MRRLYPIVLVVLVTGCGGTVSETFSEVGETLPSSDLPQSGPEPVIEGLDGQAFMDALIAEGFVCGDPQPFTTSLQQWRCTAQASDAEGLAYEVIVLGESPAAVHSIDASVDQLLAAAPDPNLSAGFLSFIAETAEFSGADPAAARDWVAQNASTESVQIDVAGVTYNLRGPAELRALEIVATE